MITKAVVFCTDALLWTNCKITPKHTQTRKVRGLLWDHSSTFKNSCNKRQKAGIRSKFIKYTFENKTLLRSAAYTVVACACLQRSTCGGRTQALVKGCMLRRTGQADQAAALIRHSLQKVSWVSATLRCCEWSWSQPDLHSVVIMPRKRHKLFYICY